MSKQPNQRQRERAFRSSMRRLVSPDAHRWAMPVIALVMLIGIIAGAIWVSSITRQHVHLDDGTVWVTSLKNRKAARFNVKLKEPDSAVASSAARFDIVQHDSDTVLTEGAKATGISSATLGTTGRTETKGRHDRGDRRRHHRLPEHEKRQRVGRSQLRPQFRQPRHQRPVHAAGHRRQDRGHP